MISWIPAKYQSLQQRLSRYNGSFIDQIECHSLVLAKLLQNDVRLAKLLQVRSSNLIPKYEVKAARSIDKLAIGNNNRYSCY